MKSLKKLGLSLILICVLNVLAFGGETQSPPCASPVPGEVQSPPCELTIPSSQDPYDSDQLVSSDSITLTEYAATEVTIGLLQSALSLF